MKSDKLRLLKSQGLLDKTLECVEKLDNILFRKVRKYEKYYNLSKLKNDLAKFIIIYKKYNFNIEVKRHNKFELDYIIYLDDDYMININIDFNENGKYIFYTYNNIYLISKNGEILNNWTNECMVLLNEE